MRTRRTGRLLVLTALDTSRISRSSRWRRWRVATVVEATADGLRTLVCQIAGERAGAGRARRRWRTFKGLPPPLSAQGDRLAGAGGPRALTRDQAPPNRALPTGCV